MTIVVGGDLARPDGEEHDGDGAPGVVTDSRDLATVAARAAAAKQGESVVILDVRELIAITDYFVITSGSSERQVRTLAEEIEKALRSQGVRPVRREGEVEARWVLLDYVDFVVHVFFHEEREFYRLERLWRDAPIVAWEEPAAKGGTEQAGASDADAGAGAGEASG